MNIQLTTKGNRTSLRAVRSDSDRLAVKDVCRLLGIGHSTFYRRRQAGLIPEPVEAKPQRWARGQFKFTG